MKLKILAREMRETAEEHLIRGASGRVPTACRRFLNVDHHDLSFVLTLHEIRNHGLVTRRWQLSVRPEHADSIEPRVMNRILHAFFGHSDFAHEPDPEQYRYNAEAHDPTTRTFFCSAA